MHLFSPSPVLEVFTRNELREGDLKQIFVSPSAGGLMKLALCYPFVETNHQQQVRRQIQGVTTP